jgi:hypothetical protein
MNKLYIKLTVKFFLTIIICLSFITIAFSGMGKFKFGGIKLGATAAKMKNIFAENKCIFLDKQVTMLCSDYQDAAHLMTFSQDKILIEVISKMDITNPEKTFQNKLKEFKSIYGKINEINKKKRYALVTRGEKKALIKVNEKLFFYALCTEKYCNRFKELLQ